MSSDLVSPLFTDVVQCLGIPLLEIKKSESDTRVCVRKFLSGHLSGISLPRLLWPSEGRPNTSRHSQFLTGELCQGDLGAKTYAGYAGLQ